MIEVLELNGPSFTKATRLIEANILDVSYRLINSQYSFARAVPVKFESCFSSYST